VKSNNVFSTGSPSLPFLSNTSPFPSPMFPSLFHFLKGFLSRRRQTRRILPRFFFKYTPLPALSVISLSAFSPSLYLPPFFYRQSFNRAAVIGTVSFPDYSPDPNTLQNCRQTFSFSAPPLFFLRQGVRCAPCFLTSLTSPLNVFFSSLWGRTCWSIPPSFSTPCPSFPFLEKDGNCD